MKEKPCGYKPNVFILWYFIFITKGLRNIFYIIYSLILEREWFFLSILSISTLLIN